MNKDNFLSLFLKGSLIGISNVVPGVSGGTIAYCTNCYTDMIYSLSNITKDFKKSFWYLLKLFIGIAFGVILGSFVLSELFNIILLEMLCLFSGFIIGSIINDKENYKVFLEGKKIKYIISFIIPFLIVLGLSILNLIIKNNETEEIINERFNSFTIKDSIILFLIMVLGVTCMLIPGISGSLTFMIFGVYYKTINFIKDLFILDNYKNEGFIFNALMVIIPLALGALVTFIFISKPLNLFYTKAKNVFNFVVLGFLISSIISMFILNINSIINDFSIWHLLLSIFVFLPLGLAFSILLNKLKKKIEKI